MLGRSLPCGQVKGDDAMKRMQQKNYSAEKKGEDYMKVIEYFEQTSVMQKLLREQIVQADWRAAKYLYEMLTLGQLKEQYGESTRLLLLVENADLLAFCTLAERDEVAEEETEPDMKPWIGFAYTYPEHRGNRYSEKLIRFACELAERDGYEKVYLSSDKVGLYEKYGFVFLKRLHTVWGEETQVFEKKSRDERESCDCNVR